LANAYRGEIDATIGGKSYRLCLTLGALAELENAYGEEDMAAIAERLRQYEGLKQAVAGILYMRNKLEAEIRERRTELVRTQDLTRRAVLTAFRDCAGAGCELGES